MLPSLSGLQNDKSVPASTKVSPKRKDKNSKEKKLDKSKEWGHQSFPNATENEAVQLGKSQSVIGADARKLKGILSKDNVVSDALNQTSVLPAGIRYGGGIDGTLSASVGEGQGGFSTQPWTCNHLKRSLGCMASATYLCNFWLT